MSVYRRSGAKRWTVSVDVGMKSDKNGKLKRVRHMETFPTKKEAVAREAELRTDIGKDTFVKPSNLTVGEWLDEWLETKVNLRSTTRAGYERDVRRIKKALGPRKLRDLSPTAINRWYGDLGKTLSAKTIQNCHGVFFSALAAAVDRDVILRNPAARGIELPKVERAEVQVWTKDELQSFMKHASGHRWYPAIALAIGSGMRRSEVLGLRWVNCDLDARIVRVRDTLVPVNGGMEHRINITKSKKSRRDIPLDDTTAAILKAHKKSQVEERMASKVWDDRDFVFTDQIGRPIRPTSFSRT